MLLGFGCLYKFAMFYLFLFIFFFKKQKIIDNRKPFDQNLEHYLFVFAYRRLGSYTNKLTCSRLSV